MDRWTQRTAAAAGFLVAIALSGCASTDAPPSRSTVVYEMAPQATPPTAAKDTRTSPAASPVVGGELTVKTIDRRGKSDQLKPRFHAALAEITSAGRIPVVMFTADWCKPCSAIKALAVDNPSYRKRLAGVDMLIINISRWRSQAKHLVPGAVPDVLPLVARLDAEGRPVRTNAKARLSFSSEADALNSMARLVWGDNPPAWDQPTVTVDKDLPSDEAPDDVEIVSVKTKGKTQRVVLNLTLRNDEHQRRWFILPALGDDPVTVRFNRVVRERFGDNNELVVERYEGGRQPMLLIPVAAWGTVRLNNYVVDVPRGTEELTFWKVLTATLDDRPASFGDKVPQHVVIADANVRQRLSAANKRGTLIVDVGDSHTLMLQ